MPKAAFDIALEKLANDDLSLSIPEIISAIDSAVNLDGSESSYEGTEPLERCGLFLDSYTEHYKRAKFDNAEFLLCHTFADYVNDNYARENNTYQVWAAAIRKYQREKGLRTRFFWLG